MRESCPLPLKDHCPADYNMSSSKTKEQVLDDVRERIIGLCNIVLDAKGIEDAPTDVKDFLKRPAKQYDLKYKEMIEAFDYLRLALMDEMHQLESCKRENVYLKRLL